MKKRINVGVTAIWWATCLFLLVSVLPMSAAAQGCEDCQIIKKGVPAITPGAAAPTAIAPVAAQPTETSSPAAPVARLTLYWSESCGHCDEILDGLLPRLQQQYGPQLEARLIEVVSLEDISAFFDLAEAYGYARGRASVPFLLIGDRALLGVEQIERELPDLIVAALAAGGADWPAPPAQAKLALAGAVNDDACSFAAPCAEETTPAAVLAATTQDNPSDSHGLLVLAVAATAIIVLAIGATVGLRRARGRDEAELIRPYSEE